MKKRTFLTSLIIAGGITTALLLSVPHFSKAQIIENSPSLVKKYKSLDSQGYWFCHCETKGTKCGCIPQ